MSLQISAKTRTLAIIGDPIEHSLTPRIQNAALRAIDADLLNVAFHVSPNELKAAVLGARALGVLGLMVTIPHKEAVLELCDELNDSATLLGAANLLHFRADGKIIGHSSDGWGAVKSLEENGVHLAGKNVTILGGGGSARSLALTLTQQKVASIRIVNRTVSRAQIIADEVAKLGVPVAAYSTDALEESLSNSDLLINTTSVGMTPHIEETPLDKSLLRLDLAVFDIVYNPIETRLLREARQVGAKAIDGLGMLIYTNVYAAKVCAGLDISVAIMRDEAMRAFAERET